MRTSEALDRILRSAHDRSYKQCPDSAALVCEMLEALGRATVAQLTSTPDQKTLSRWSQGRNEPTPERLALLREAAMFYYALLHLGLSPHAAEQWFRGANPTLGFALPIDVLKERRYADLAAALSNHLTV